MAAIEVKDGNPLGAIRELLRSLMSRGVVGALLVPEETPSGKAVVHTLVRDPARLDVANPLAPVFGVNAARIVVKMCARQLARSPAEAAVAQVGAAVAASAGGAQAHDVGGASAPRDDQEKPAPEKQPAAPPTGLVLRPCEIRALVELVKLQQATLDPFLVIGVDCWGTYSVKDYAAKAEKCAQGASVTAEFLKQMAGGSLPADLRSACQACRRPAPTFADIAIQLIGEDVSRKITVRAQTEKGKAALAAAGLEESPENPERAAALEKLAAAKDQAAKEGQFNFLELIETLCINCHNCREVCPICYCRQCAFDGPVFAYTMDKYLTWSGKKGALSMPPDKLLFHLTRMSHVATSCVACGQCEAACPSGIPLGRIYRRISAAAQEALGYEAGRSLEDELPLATFRETELAVVES
ncbi:MAG: hypothetical protein FJ291_20985 [Planctomycetes bacterium]|nr:hypothetical protein [Planctomycetota bacterium]